MFPDASELRLIANLGQDSMSFPDRPSAPLIFSSDDVNDDALKQRSMPPWSVAWFLKP
jgi:hypothetical protein